MYRKKNAVEKDTDAKNCALASSEEHKVVGDLILEAQDYGPSGYARIGALEFVKLEDAHTAACMVHRQAQETHVGDGEGIQGKWDHTTHSAVYEKD
jgi:hypothetical protein